MGFILEIDWINRILRCRNKISVMPSFCTECGKKPTTKEVKGGAKRTIDPFLKVCNECQPLPNNTQTGVGGARRRNDSSIDADVATEPAIMIPDDLISKSGSELSATDLYRIVSAAMKETNQKIDKIDKDIQNRMVTLENRVKILESEGEKKDEDIEQLKHTVISMQRALNSIDQEQRSVNAIISGLSEDKIVIPGDQENRPVSLEDDMSKIKYIAKLMEIETNEGTDEDIIRNITISRIGKPREGMHRMIKLVFLNMEDRNNFVKNSSKMKTAPDTWKRVYIKKDQHPVYANENNRLRKKLGTLRRDPINAEKAVILKDGKITVDGTMVDQNLFFH